MKKLTLLLVIVSLALPAYANTVAYWRFDDGPAGEPVRNPLVRHGIEPDGTYYPGVVDHSGNGNHLSAWTEGAHAGYEYSSDVAYPEVPLTGQPNNYSVRNTGDVPGMFTDSASSNPAGIDLETWSPSAWTVEATFKPESGGWRTLIGKDSFGLVDNPDLAGFYFQFTPEDAVKVAFADNDGHWHEAISDDGMIQGYDWGSDPDGVDGNWYSMVGVSDGSMLSVYLMDITGGSEWQLVAQTDIAGSGSEDTSMAIGAGEGDDWHAGSWTVGRGMYGGGHGDRAYGFIDEVRISEGALSVNEFLVPEPATLMVLGIGSLVLIRRRRS